MSFALGAAAATVIGDASLFVAKKAGDKVISSALSAGEKSFSVAIRERRPSLWLKVQSVRSNLTSIRSVLNLPEFQSVHFVADGSASNVRELCKILHRSMRPDFDARSFYDIHQLDIARTLKDYLSGTISPRLVVDLTTALASSIRFARSDVQQGYVSTISNLFHYMQQNDFRRDFAREHSAIGGDGNPGIILDANIARAGHRIDCLTLRNITNRPDLDVSNLAVSVGDLNVYLNQAMVSAVRHIQKGDPESALRVTEVAIGQFRAQRGGDNHRALYTINEGVNSLVEVALANVLRSRARALLILGSRSDRRRIGKARRSIRLAYFLYIKQKPPWIHGVANSLLLAAGASLLERKTTRAQRFMFDAQRHYAWTGDHLLAERISHEQQSLLMADDDEAAAVRVLTLAV